MATLNDMITSVKQNLGNRSSGVIGGTPVDTVVLAGLNKGFKNIIKMANPYYYDRMVSLDIVVGTNIYPYPTQDIDGNTIKIKQFGASRLFQVGNTDIYHTRQVTAAEYLMFRVPDDADTGIPSTYTCYANKIWFVKYPDNAYTLQIAVNIVPADWSATQVNAVLPVEDIWIETIEAYTTHYCFAKLQQTQDSQYWFTLYENSKRENKGLINKEPNLRIPMEEGGRMGDPITDPFVRRFNS